MAHSFVSRGRLGKAGRAYFALAVAILATEPAVGQLTSESGATLPATAELGPEANSTQPSLEAIEIAYRLPNATRAFVVTSPVKVSFSPPTAQRTFIFRPGGGLPAPEISAAEMFQHLVWEGATSRIAATCPPLLGKCTEEARLERLPFVAWTSAEYDDADTVTVAVACIASFTKSLTRENLQALCRTEPMPDSPTTRPVFAFSSAHGAGRLYVASLDRGLLLCSTDLRHLSELSDALARADAPEDAKFSARRTVWSYIDRTAACWGVCCPNSPKRGANATEQTTTGFFLDPAATGKVVVRHAGAPARTRETSAMAAQPWKQLYDLDVAPSQVDPGVVETRVEFLGLLDGRFYAEGNTVRMSPTLAGAWLMDLVEANLSMALATRPRAGR